jgi:dipeptidyl aminopeptidase/acylaminoacyl peptidase
MSLSKSFILLVCFCALAVCDDFPYKQPPPDVRDALNALPTPVASVSPARDAVIFMQAVRYPPLAEVAQPMQRLAGIRIDEQTNGLYLAANYVSFSLKRLPDGAEVPLTLPKEGKLGAPVWSPDGKQFAFTNITARGIDLWIGSTATGQTRRVDGVRINGVRFSANDNPVEWMGDNRTLLIRTIPAGRGAPPAPPKVPKGPNVQESLGNAGPAPTYEDLLATSHDEDLFEYYATSQLAYLDTASGKVTPIEKPRIYNLVRVSPDQNHLLTSRIHRPYSYQLPATAFPQAVEVWDRDARTMEYRVADLPLSDRVPLGGVRTGPRGYQWLPSKPATLAWAEALDKGDPKAKVPYRERIMTLAAPFSGQPAEAAKIEERLRGMQMLANGKALVEDFERVKRTVRMLEVNLDLPSKDQPGSPTRVVFSRNERDAYHDPGDPVMKTWPDGRRAVLQSGDDIFMTGPGSTPSGDRPFVDRFNLTNGKSQRLFQSTADAFEEVVAVLDEAGTRLLTRRESPSEPPNYFVRDGAEAKALTHMANPVPAALKVKKQLVTYKRADGVPLSFTLYLPPDYKPGTRLPALLWAYPYEFSDADTAGQVTGHAAQAFPELNYHQLGVLHGYALIDNAAMPIIGDADTVNDTYVQQLLMDAQAAVDKAVEMGVVDRDRVGVFGHSYGAFMTANLLAHSKLFRAAVAESGAYNRSLTPFGFQAERRTFWEAPDVYTKMSPFWFADQIKTPVLLIHGEADDNTGTYPIQSERMFAAIRGNGGTVRLVMLPAEAHGYRGKESLEHVLYEELSWFDKYLR